MDKVKFYTLFLIGLGILCLSTKKNYAQNHLGIIPKPTQVEVYNGAYRFPEFVEVYASVPFLESVELLREHPHIQFENPARLKNLKRLPETGILLLEADESDPLPKKAYRLEIDTSRITLTAHNHEALLYGISTLMQLGLLQPDGVIQTCKIIDEPNFGYRGMMLDVSRHFYPLSFIKKFIDLMALYKFNTFHWHLTDGAGWRLAINKYPELTEVAAWRSYTNWKDWWNKGRQYLHSGDPDAYGGYYSQREAKELVAYAAKKGITVIPEIEMPGHSEAVLAVYPELSCSGVAYKNAEYCLGNEKTFEFLFNVFDEVMAIFPSRLIHIGGDEADKKAWEACAKCQERMKTEGLSSLEELQRYAVERVGKHLAENGRELLGWDEILEGGIPENATVMSWRGEQGGVEAANAGHHVIMTPAAHLYLDSYQTNPIGQPEAIGGYLPLDKVYAYNPLADGLTADGQKNVLGLQANIWTEYMPTQEQVEYMAFPRALAVAEVGWTGIDQKDWGDFRSRLQHHYQLLQRLNVNYYRPSYDVSIKAKFNTEQNRDTITILSEQYNPEIRYTIDGSTPTKTSQLYTEPFYLVNSAVVKAAVFRDSVLYGDVQEYRSDIHKGIGKKITYNKPWDKKYPAQGDESLLNGQKGGLTYDDQQWQGFLDDLDVTIDFERREELSKVSLRFMQLTGPGIYMPANVRILASDDGKHFRELHKIQNDVSNQDETLRFKTFEFDLSGRLARYIRIIAKNEKKAYLFTDEIVIY